MRLRVPPMFLLALALAGCDRPAPSDYWSGPGPGGMTTGGLTSGGQSPGGARTFERLMAEGTRANLAGRPAEAEARFREALAEQRKRSGGGEALALPTMSLALQLSASGRFAQADGQFAEAERLLTGSKDRALKARFAHYRGVHLLNEGQAAAADGLLGQAQAAYTALIPEDDLTRAPVPPSQNGFDVNGTGRTAPPPATVRAGGDPVAQPALLGLIEVLRYRAVALRTLGRPEEARALTTRAARIAAANNLGRPSVYARVYLTAGVTAAEEARRDEALADLGRSDDAFEAALPGTRPAAEAALVHAGGLMRAGKTRAAASACRRAVKTLAAIAAGTTPELMAPCLEAFASGGFLSGGGPADMFFAAQIAQGTITSHQIARASAALAESARDPRVGAALRRRDQWQREIDRLYRALDTLGSTVSGRAAEQQTELRQQAEQAQAALTTAEAEVRTLSPDYGQLVQDVVPASAVFGALRPDEAFVAVFLSRSAGWTFALRNGDIAVARIPGGADAVAPLVRAVRAGIEKTQAATLPVFDGEAARRLYGLVLGGVADRIQGATSLTIAPTGPLLSLPFELLLTGPADPAHLAAAPFLVRQAAIAHVPAATNFVGLRRVANTSAATKPWFGFGDFRPVSLSQAQRSFPVAACGDSGRRLASLPPLPGAVKELENARAVLNAAPGDSLLGQAFTAERVPGLALKDYKILHFAAHALLPADLRCQTEAAIVTSPPPGASDAGGALLTASRVLGLDLDANLVILSACNSGGPDGGGGESLSGLARSFFFARARSLMVTHWDVDDRAAALLVVLTIDTMREKPGLGVAGALRAAQLGLLERAASGKLPPEIAHPFFWAPFAVIGDGGGRAG